MTNPEINDRATTIANLAALASKLDPGPERMVIMQVAVHLADALTRPAYVVTKDGNVIPFTGGKK